MKVYTAHTRPQATPVLVREGFAWGAFVFGPFWLFARRAWVAGVLALCGWVLVALIHDQTARWLLGFALCWLAGLFGRDLWRWSLERRGYDMPHVVAASQKEEALGRLLDRRPDLIADALR